MRPLITRTTEMPNERILVSTILYPVIESLSFAFGLGGRCIDCTFLEDDDKLADSLFTRVSVFTWVSV